MCAGLSLPGWCPALEYRRTLLAWWETTVPGSLRLRSTDYLASRVLMLSHDPATTLRHWIAVGDCRPWLSAERGLSFLRAVDDYRAGRLETP